MENYYDIDTDTLTSIATEAINASTAVKECADLLNTLLQHEDWCCKEKDAINDSILQIKTDSINASETFEEFSTAVKNTAQRYVDMVNEEQKDILDINQSIGNLYASELGTVTPSVTSGASTNAYIDSTCTLPGSAADCNTVYNLNSSIQIVDYKDISQVVSFER